MATVRDCLKIIEELAPQDYTYSAGEINGLVLGCEDAPVSRILCCLDATIDVAEEAAEKGVDLVVAHHPLIFLPTKTITANDPIGRRVLKFAENKIAVICAHTNLDFAPEGINDYWAEILGLNNVTPLFSYGAKGGAGRIGDLKSPVSTESLKKTLCSISGDKYVKYISRAAGEARRVAVVNGGGADYEYVDAAVRLGADCFISGDIPHHIMLHAWESGLKMFEVGHFSMEHIYISRLRKRLAEKCEALKVEVLQAQSEKNPVLG